MKSVKILFITTSHDKIGDATGKTGVWLEELAAPYYLFKDAGAEVTVASPLGGLVPLDPKSQSVIVATQSSKRFLKDKDAMDFLSHSIPLEAVKTADFDVAFLPGGHGPMWDLADNKTLKQLLESFNKESKPIGAVSHGVAGLLSLQNDNGEFLIKGKDLTGFSNSEEGSTGLAKILPFLLETRLFLLDALYSKGTDYVSYVVTDGNIVTGQNAASAEGVAKKIIALVRNYKLDPTYFKLAIN
jgi:putative intracellular protease/amidase